MRVAMKRIHVFEAIGPAGLGGPARVIDLPRNLVYIGLMIRCVMNVVSLVVPPVRTEDGEYRMASRIFVRRDGGTPIDVDPRQMGLLDAYNARVIHDVQETNPLVIGANVLEHTHYIPFADPCCPLGSAGWAESLLVAPRRKTLQVGIRPPIILDDIYTAAGGAVALAALVYEVFAQVLEAPTVDEVKALNALDREMRFQSQEEPIALGVAQAYGVYRGADLDRNVRPLRIGLLSLDAGLRTAVLLEEASAVVAGEFKTPENCPANVLKADNVRSREVDLPDGFDVVELDHAHDHASAPWAPDTAAFRIWRTTAGPVGIGALGSIQQSIGPAEYVEKI